MNFGGSTIPYLIVSLYWVNVSVFILSSVNMLTNIILKPLDVVTFCAFANMANVVFWIALRYHKLSMIMVDNYEFA